jgi:hypothetical protein
MPIQVVFYHTTDCHLCDLAEAMVTPLLTHYGLIAEAIDVAEDSDAFAAYGEQIPVLYFPATNVAITWPFDPSDIAARFELLAT